MFRHSKLVQFSFLSVLLSLLSCSFTPVPDNNSLPENMTSGYLTSRSIAEASGIAVSRKHPGVVWLNNDSGNSPVLFAVNTDGKELVRMTIHGTKNKDWEDLAIFTYNQHTYILIADTGDNGASRSSYQLHFIREPELSDIALPANISAEPEWSITFRYNDGSHDCEAVAVDIKHQQILLLSKRGDIPVLYMLPFTPGSSTTATAVKQGVIRPFPQPEKKHFRLIDLFGYTLQPTAMDIRSDGLGIAILTYGDAYYYPASEHDSWLSVLRQKPEIIALPELAQAEGIGFDAQSRNLFVVTEKLPAPLLRINRYSDQP